MSYKETINLPKTDFRMRANLAALEPAMQKKWDEMDLYGKVREARRGATKYVLHDGPPYPTGALHLGTGLNKLLKDFLVRYKTMRGFDAPYVPGWDCHGLPIEWKVLQDVGEKRHSMSQSEIRRRCRQYALRYVDVQRAQFKSLGVMGDWDNPYLTINPSYEAGILEVFARMARQGFIYRDLKPIHWCYHCRTALAEAELEYEDVSGPSIYVNFPLEGDVSEMFGLDGQTPVNLLIWTTTPWTLPANLAVAVNPRATYTAVRYRHPATGEAVVSIVGEALAGIVMRAVGVEDYETCGSVKGERLAALTYRHPFMERVCPVLTAGYVSVTEGTGCVHTAPGHGQEDYLTGLEHNLDILSPVDENGYFTEEAGMFAGQRITEGDEAICAHLREGGYLLHRGSSVHSYPHCWRCREPVIFRATEQWFVRMDHRELRQRALSAVSRTEWAPAWGEQRMRQMIAERPDWCISRQRSWGVPIPAFYCRNCGKALLDADVAERVAQVFGERGSDSWFEDEGTDLFLPEGTRCECGAADWEKESDILDVWFESGSSHNSVCRKRADLAFPADLYLEGVDQYRGWFQLSLMPSLAAWDEAPFKGVLIHGFVVDEDGKKMSKSLGNFISVADGIERFRAEILRLWCSSIDFQDQIRVSEDYLRKGMVDAYRRVRNTFRFLLGNTADFDPARHSVPYDRMREMDRWALDELARLVKRVEQAWESYELHQVYGSIHNFCAVTMSSTYLDALKDRLYCSGADWPERRSAQTALHHALLTLCKLTAPILAHTAEEVWSHIEHPDEEVESVHLCHWPQPPEQWLDDQLHERWSRLLSVRDDVARAVETLREEKKVAQGMEAAVTLASGGDSLRGLLLDSREALLELLMCSELTVLGGPGAEGLSAGRSEPDLLVGARPSEHRKCARCWNLRPTVGRREEHPDLCARCAAVIDELEGK
ncbi:MAG: isoleucine--tRNA ligase [Planctomycetes bacterium]|nr:isoleucine--tRNA ligase [Planctomycetota bacterium]